jgi:SPP1 family predicted phage head-tail adaptor
VTELSPSDLRHRLTLEELSRVTDDGGGFTESWVEVATIFADLRPIRGSERVEADRLTGNVTHDVVLRYRPGVVPSMRFREDTRIFQIVAVIDVEKRRR